MKKPVNFERILWPTDLSRESEEGLRYAVARARVYAAGQEVDLICIGAHGKGFRLGAIFGSTADRVLRESRRPVLVARPFDHDAAPRDAQI